MRSISHVALSRLTRAERAPCVRALPFLRVRGLATSARVAIEGSSSMRQPTVPPLADVRESESPRRWARSQLARIARRPLHAPRSGLPPPSPGDTREERNRETKDGETRARRERGLPAETQASGGARAGRPESGAEPRASSPRGKREGREGGQGTGARGAGQAQRAGRTRTMRAMRLAQIVVDPTVQLLHGHGP